MLWIDIPYPSVMQFMATTFAALSVLKSEKISIRSFTCLFVGNSPGGKELAALKTSQQCNFFMTAPE